MGMLSDTWFWKKAYGQHINVIDKVFQYLSTKKKNTKQIYERAIKGIRKDHGNVDLLSHRLSNVRTWSYVAIKKTGRKLRLLGSIN